MFCWTSTAWGEKSGAANKWKLMLDLVIDDESVDKIFGLESVTIIVLFT